MTQQDIEAVLERVQILEKENRRLKRGGLAILLIVLFGGAAALAPIFSHGVQAVKTMLDGSLRH